MCALSHPRRGAAACIPNPAPRPGEGSAHSWKSLVPLWREQSSWHSSADRKSGVGQSRAMRTVQTGESTELLSCTAPTRLWANPRSCRAEHSSSCGALGEPLALPMAQCHRVPMPLWCPWPGRLALSWGLKTDPKCFICKPLTKITLTCKQENGKTIRDSQLSSPLWKTQMFSCHKAAHSSS